MYAKYLYKVSKLFLTYSHSCSHILYTKKAGLKTFIMFSCFIFKPFALEVKIKKEKKKWLEVPKLHSNFIFIMVSNSSYDVRVAEMDRRMCQRCQCLLKCANCDSEPEENPSAQSVSLISQALNSTTNLVGFTHILIF